MGRRYWPGIVLTMACAMSSSRVEEPISGPTVIAAAPMTHRFPRPLRAALLDTSICLEGRHVPPTQHVL
jgi:hypothetical protein